MTVKTRNRRIALPGGMEIAWAAAPERDRRDVAHRLLLGLVDPDIDTPIATGHRAAGRCVTRQCPVCGSTAHGRPLIAGAPPLSIAYARPDPGAAERLAIAVVALAPPGAAGLGIDAEPATASRAMVVREALGARATLRDWTRLEAVAKARGTGLRGALPGHGAAATGDADAVTEGRVSEAPEHGAPAPRATVGGPLGPPASAAAAGLEVTHLELDPRERLPSVIVAVALLPGR